MVVLVVWVFAVMALRILSGMFELWFASVPILGC